MDDKLTVCVSQPCCGCQCVGVCVCVSSALWRHLVAAPCGQSPARGVKKNRGNVGNVRHRMCQILCQWANRVWVLVPCWWRIYCLFSSKGFDRGLLETVVSVFMADRPSCLKMLVFICGLFLLTSPKRPPGSFQFMLTHVLLLPV